MQAVMQDDHSRTTAPPVVMNATGWIGAMVVITIVYYQFPKSRGALQGIIVLVVLGIILSHYDIIKSQIKSIVKG